jgi:hypothetical protein
MPVTVPPPASPLPIVVEPFFWFPSTSFLIVKVGWVKGLEMMLKKMSWFFSFSIMGYV